MAKIKVGSDCCGVGSLIQAVKRLGIDFEESFMDNVLEYNEANPKNSLSDSQLYKQGGNSIVVACLEKIIRNLKINFE
jgi:hypothetical protein